MAVKQNRIDTIDVMRVLAMLAVIQIHTPWNGSAKSETLDGATVLDYLTRFAVPFFFVISGYLWAARCTCADDYWPRCVALSKRILLIFLFWSVVYAAVYSVHVIRQEGVSSLTAFLVAVVYPFDAPGFANAALTGTKNHLWFLPALAIAALISGALLSRRREFTLFVLAILLFIVGLDGTAYSDAPFGFTSHFNFRNGPFLSLIMFVSGYAIHRYGQRLPLLPVGIGIAIGGFAMLTIESAWIHQRWGSQLTHDYVVGTYFFGVGMSMIALSNTHLLRARSLASIGPLILGVYASHFLFVDRVHWLERVVHEPKLRETAYVAIVFLLALLTSFILSKWQRTKQFVT
jgi:surface polysaccharide O-acyltransferase-like enzyme